MKPVNSYLSVNVVDLMPIITSLLDNDLYKLTMQQVVLHQFPDIDVEYKFQCRTPGIDLRPYRGEIEAEIDHLCNLRFHSEELAYLASLSFIKKALTSLTRTKIPGKIP